MRGVPNNPVPCTKCGSPNAYPSVGLCNKCRPSPVQKYFWQPHQEEHLRRIYAEHVHNKFELSRAISDFAKQLGFPRYIVKNKAAQFRLCLDFRRPWKTEELDLLRRYAGAKPIRFFKKMLGRSYQSIRSMFDMLDLSYRVTAGYTRQDLAFVFGTSVYTVNRWIEMRWLVPSALTGRIPETKVLRFIKEHPEEYRLKRVDEAWFKGLLFPLMGIRLISKRGKERAA